MKPSLLTEISGLYGPVSIPERVLQKIWWRGEFHQGHLRTLSGKSLRRLQPGRWNKQEGPDFIDAVLQLGDTAVQGDVEVHFYAEDWQAHGHHRDPAFDNVVLHVLLFPPRRAVTLPTHSGRSPEVLVLLPHLHEDIEDYADREALLALEIREKSGWIEALLAHPEHERLPLLRAKAEVRWKQKIRFARQRLATHGWEAACHQLALETLGLKRNRAPMSALSQRHSLDAMRRVTADLLFAEQRDQWHLAGLRPANHPRRRLQQYLALLEKNPDWPARLLGWGDALPNNTVAENDTARFRRTARFPATLRQLQENVLAGAIGGTRLHTLAIDALLPLLAANGTAPNTCLQHWFHWPVGDIPARLATTLRTQLPTENSRAPIISNGLFQGLFQLSHELG